MFAFANKSQFQHRRSRKSGAGLSAVDSFRRAAGARPIAPFLERHDRRTRRNYIVLLSISLVLAAIVFTHRLQATGAAPGAVLDDLWAPVIWAPLTICLLWLGSAAYGRNRPKPLSDGSIPMNADDARSVARVANAGAVFVNGMCAIMIAGQLAWLAAALGLLQLPETAAGWGVRALLLGTGALSAFFGNAWPRIPTPRAPGQHPGAHIRYQRFSGWLTVIFGLLIALAAFVPYSAMTPVVIAAVALITGGSIAGFIVFRIALNARSVP